MSTPLHIAIDIVRLLAEARMRDSPIDVPSCAAELYLRFLDSGCSRTEILAALYDEARAAGVIVR